MEKNKFNKKIVLPENTPSIIEEVVEKYNLEKYLMDEEIEKRLKEAETPEQRAGIKFLFSEKLNKMLNEAKDVEEKRKIIEGLPGSQIAKILYEFSMGKIPFQVLTSALQERLEIPRKTAENITKDLQQKIPTLAQESPKKKFIYKKPIKSHRTTKLSMPSKQDIYREPIK